MVNSTIAWADELGLRVRPEPGIELVVEPSLSVDGDVDGNLAVRAFAGFFRELGFSTPPVGFSCHLTKRLPVGAGLGGGSSDAAAVLRWLGTLFGSALAEVSIDVFPVLERAALACGADVPFFLTRGLCNVTGIGETVTPLVRTEDVIEVLVVVPRTAVNTKEFYSFFRDQVPVVQPLPLREVPVHALGFEDLSALVGNDFEPHVCALAPEVQRVLTVVRAVFPLGSAVTGSGAALFALVPPGEKGRAEALRERLTASEGARAVLTSLEL
jgi:4-diphosphocytidyl-2-C-methyl-D-erythritol kinase